MQKIQFDSAPMTITFNKRYAFLHVIATIGMNYSYPMLIFGICDYYNYSQNLEKALGEFEALQKGKTTIQLFSSEVRKGVVQGEVIGIPIRHKYFEKSPPEIRDKTMDGEMGRFMNSFTPDPQAWTEMLAFCDYLRQKQLSFHGPEVQFAIGK